MAVAASLFPSFTSDNNPDQALPPVDSRLSAENKDDNAAIIRKDSRSHVENVTMVGGMPEDVAPLSQVQPASVPTKPGILPIEQVDNDTQQLHKADATLTLERRKGVGRKRGNGSPGGNITGGRVRRTTARRKESAPDESEEGRSGDPCGEIRPRLGRGLHKRASREKKERRRVRKRESADSVRSPRKRNSIYNNFLREMVSNLYDEILTFPNNPIRSLSILTFDTYHLGCAKLPHAPLRLRSR